MVNDRQNKEIEQLYRSMYDTLYCYAQLNAEQLAPPEEIVQEVFKIACSRPDELLDSCNQQGWLMTAVKNVIRNLYKRHKHSQTAIQKLTVEAEQDYLLQELPVSLNVLYGPLAETEDFKLLLEQGKGDSVQSLARDRSISEDACKKRLERARSTLRKKILKL